MEHIESPLMQVLQTAEIDMTLFYRGLADVPSDEQATDDARLAPIKEAYQLIR